MYKRQFKKIILLTLVFVLLGSGYIFLIDPFFHYHVPYFNLKPSFYDSLYQNPGVIDHLEYDSIITGSSMAQNFKVSQFNEAFDVDSVKVIYVGGKSLDMKNALSRTLENRKIKKVLMGLDINMLTSAPDETRNPYPEYLYNKNPFDDVKYLLNKDVLFKSSQRTLKQNKSDLSRDLAYSWDNSKIVYSKEAVLKTKKRTEVQPVNEVTEMDIIRIHDNINNIKEYIKDYPDTEFLIFYPPYSVLFWDLWINKGDYDYAICALKESVQELVQYDNVELHFFHDMFDVTKNLDNYKDYTHYSPEIYEIIIDKIKTKEYQITQQNMDERFDAFEKEIKLIDFEGYYK